MSEYYIHPAAIVETKEIGENTKIWAFSHVLEGAKIGANCNIGDSCFIENGVDIGDNVTIKNGNMLFEGVTLEDGVFVGPHIFFTNDPFPRSPRLSEAKKRYQSRDWFRPTLVKHGASLGAACVIIAGVTVGEFAMVGAGSIVTKNVQDHALIIGNPARQIGWVCKCGIKLSFNQQNAVCRECGLEYVKDGNRIQCIN